MFSSKWATEEVPGMGSITGDFRSNQASATCAGRTPSLLATIAKAPPGFARLPVARGYHGIKPMLCFVQ